jgi:hypothetical protein
MQYFKTLSGKEFNPRDLISFAKYKYANDPRKWSEKGYFAGIGDSIRSKFGVLNYDSGQEIDPTFDYNKFDWSDVNDTVASWSTSADSELQNLAKGLSPLLSESAGDRGIYRAAELQTQIAQTTAKGSIDAQEAQWNAVLSGDGSANTIKFLEDNKAASLASLTQQAALMKKQIEAATASGRMEIEADYAGITEEITLGVQKLQEMTVDEYAARGMAFSGTLNRASADIAAAGATQLAKAMAQKGARLGKLVNDLIAYTAQIDMDVLGKQTDIVAQYGLQIASLMDKDEQVRSDAKAVLAALAVQKGTLGELAPLEEESAKLDVDAQYNAATAKADADAEQKTYDRNMDAARLFSQYGITVDSTGNVTGMQLTPLQEWNVIHDQALLLGMYGITVNEDKDGNVSFSVDPTKGGTVKKNETINDGWTDPQARSYLIGLEELEAKLNSTPAGALIPIETLSQGARDVIGAAQGSALQWTKESLATYLANPNTQARIASAKRHDERSRGARMSVSNAALDLNVRDILADLERNGVPITAESYELRARQFFEDPKFPQYVEESLQEKMPYGGGSGGGTSEVGYRALLKKEEERIKAVISDYFGARWLGT